MFEALETSWVAVFRHLVTSGRAPGGILFLFKTARTSFVN